MLAKWAIGISILSLGFAIWSWCLSWRVVKSQQLEAWIIKVFEAIRAKLPSNDIPHAAGLSVVSLLKSMPKELQKRRKYIVERAYERAVPGGKFDAFWKHLCEIQGQ